MALVFLYIFEYIRGTPEYCEVPVSKQTEVVMSTIFDHHQIDVAGAQLTFQSVDYQSEISLLETRIQSLEEENARLQEAMQFFLELCCGDE